MKKIKFLSKMSILFLFISLSTGCYTMINQPLDNIESQDQIAEENLDTLNVNGDYTIINNYSCSSETTCCSHDYCHTNSNSNHYHDCSGHCSLTYNWWTSSWVSYSCNYCHHWSCSGHHHGNFYGHGYFHHDYHHNSYDYGYHDGFYDGYWWGYNDGSNNNEDGSNDYSNSTDDQIERRDNSFDRTEEESEIAPNAISIFDRSLVDLPSILIADANETSFSRKLERQSPSYTIINSNVNSNQGIKPKTNKRESVVLGVAKVLFSSYLNSNESISKKKNSSKKNKSSNYSSKSNSKNKDKSSSYSSKSKKNNKKKSSSKSKNKSKRLSNSGYKR